MLREPAGNAALAAAIVAWGGDDEVDPLASLKFEGGSLYDAVAQGLKVFRNSEWVSSIAGSTVITVKEPNWSIGVRDFEA
jgi:hypothetical protein